MNRISILRDEAPIVFLKLWTLGSVLVAGLAVVAGLML